MTAAHLALRQGGNEPLAADAPLPPDDRVRLVDATDRVGIAAIYRDRAPSLLRFFRRRVHAQDAPDFVQESFARLAGITLQKRLVPENPAAYLSQIAANIIRDEACTAYQRASTTPVADEGTASFEDPLALLEARDMLRRVEHALVRLKPLTRDIFLAHRRDGLSYREVGDLTGLSIKGVEWHMTKAISHLTRTLGR